MGNTTLSLLGYWRGGKRTVLEALVVPGFRGDADQRADGVLKVNL